MAMIILGERPYVFGIFVFVFCSFVPLDRVRVFLVFPSRAGLRGSRNLGVALCADKGTLIAAKYRKHKEGYMKKKKVASPKKTRFRGRIWSLRPLLQGRFEVFAVLVFWCTPFTFQSDEQSSASLFVELLAVRPKWPLSFRDGK